MDSANLSTVKLSHLTSKNVLYAMKGFSMIMEFVKISTVKNFQNGLFVKLAGQDFLLILKQDSARYPFEVFAHNSNTLMRT